VQRPRPSARRARAGRTGDPQTAGARWGRTDVWDRPDDLGGGRRRLL